MTSPLTDVVTSFCSIVERQAALRRENGELLADLFRGEAATRRRAADLAIAAHAIGRRAVLLTHHPRGYAGIEGLTTG
jgi:predicted nucleic acid-binding protein